MCVFQIAQKDEAQRELGQATMAVFLLRENGLSTPMECSIVIDGMEILPELSSVASAYAMMFGIIYVLNLRYPEQLKYTFEAIQKIIMDIESRQMSRKVQNLFSKLQEWDLQLRPSSLNQHVLFCFFMVS